jgi:hypothetical protein
MYYKSGKFDEEETLANLTNGFTGQRFLLPILYLSFSNHLKSRKSLKVFTCQFLKIEQSSNILTVNITTFTVSHYKQKLICNLFGCSHYLHLMYTKYHIFSSPQLKAQVSISDRPCPLSVWRLSVKLLHFRFLLQNCRANCNQSWHRSSLGEGDSELFTWRATPISKGR